MDAQTLSSVLDSLKDPQITRMLEGQAQQMVVAGIKFMAFNLEPGAYSSGFATNVNVIKQDLPLPMSPSVVAQIVAGQLEGLDSVEKPVGRRQISLKSGSAEGLTIHMRNQLPDGSTIALTMLQLITVKGNSAFAVTLTTPTAEFDKYSATFDKIEQSFTILN